MINDPLAPSTADHNAGGSGPGPESRRGFAVVLIIAVGMLVVLFNLGTAKTKSVNGASKPQVAVTNPAAGSDSTAAPGATAPTDTAVATGATSAPSPDIVTMVGKVKSIAKNGDLSFNDGNADYTITMSSKPSVVNLGGTAVSTSLITVGGTIQITGSIVGSTIDAQTVIIPTK